MNCKVTLVTACRMTNSFEMLVTNLLV